MAQPFFATSNRLATVFGGADHVRREFTITVPLNPQVPSQAILDMFLPNRITALWLDDECVLVNKWLRSAVCRRYEIFIRNTSISYCDIALYQVPGTTERRAPLPALEYFLTRLTNHDGLYYVSIKCHNARNNPRTLDISPACFLNVLQTSRSLTLPLQLVGVSLTAEQTALLFAHDAGPIFMHLYTCLFHGPTLLQQLGLASLQREQTHHTGRGGSDLHITLDGEGIRSISKDELTALFSNPRLRTFRPFALTGIASYDDVKKVVSALASNQISTLERLNLFSYTHHEVTLSTIEWEKGEEQSLWISLWKAIEQHPSLEAIVLNDHPPGWPWQPIAAAVKINPRLGHVGIHKRYRDHLSWHTELVEHVEPLLERNRYRPKIAALCLMDPSTAAALLGQAIVAISGNGNKHLRCKREILRMLLDQLVLTGYDFGVQRVVGKKRPLALTVVVVPNDAVA